MSYRNVALQTARRITRRYPFTRHASITSISLIFLWIYATYVGERRSFHNHINSCSWDKWERWPSHATPHHSIVVADPQLVDPHTYPGRPWPLSRLTEIYTDLYMSRNFRMINLLLDPDSVVFLGDLFDGGREWATSKARSLRTIQREVLVHYGILAEGDIEGRKESQTNRDFVAGENGRWSKWGTKQWNTDFERFGRIFFAPDQLYPKANRDLISVSSGMTDLVCIENGGKNTTRSEYGVAGSKYRQVVASLPGNHDLGFGAGVQLPVRDRFRSHFGKTNSVYVLGNHTFVNVDAPSLSAFDEYLSEGEVTAERQKEHFQIWKPTSDFLDDLSRSAPKAVAESLTQYFPGATQTKTYRHEAIDAKDSPREPRSEIPSSRPELPVVLLTHVPLFRNPDTDCGHLREKGRSLTIGRGYQYQNVLTAPLSNTIAKKVSMAGEITQVFSGDDHDYCDVTHRFNLGRWNEDEQKQKVVLQTFREVTVKSFSWAMGVRKPGFLLVSLWNPVDELGNTIGTPLPTIQTQLCLLPDQLSIFISYAQLLGLTLLILMLRAIFLYVRNRSISYDEESEDSEDNQGTSLSLPRFHTRTSSKRTGNRNGSSGRDKSANRDTQGRQRASSTSTSTFISSNSNLGVQRSYNARTRSISPYPLGAESTYRIGANTAACPNLQEHEGPLIEKAGYYPSLRWQDPDESDEESHLGDDLQDSQAKLKKQKRQPSRARRALDEFFASLVFVAIPSGLFYGFLIKNG